MGEHTKEDIAGAHLFLRRRRACSCCPPGGFFRRPCYTTGQNCEALRRWLRFGGIRRCRVARCTTLFPRCFCFCFFLGGGERETRVGETGRKKKEKSKAFLFSTRVFFLSPSLASISAFPGAIHLPLLARTLFCKRRKVHRERLVPNRGAETI